jgi:uncharacterized protein YegP (UPF0339 family)
MRVATIFQDQAGDWRWHVKAENGEIVAQGESYVSKSDAKRGLEDARVEHDEVQEADGSSAA